MCDLFLSLWAFLHGGTVTLAVGSDHCKGHEKSLDIQCKLAQESVNVFSLYYCLSLKVGLPLPLVNRSHLHFSCVMWQCSPVRSAIAKQVGIVSKGESVIAGIEFKN